jgi:ribonuclease HI
MGLHIRINFDGACNNHLIKQGINPPMGLGISVFINNEYCEELSKFVGVPGEINNSSNIAEWQACIEAMKLAAELFDTDYKDTFEIQSDSQLISYQFNGTYHVHEKKFKPYYHDALKYARKAKIKNIKWVKREFNKEADRLSKKGLQSITMINDSKAISGNHQEVNKRA